MLPKPYGLSLPIQFFLLFFIKSIITLFRNKKQNVCIGKKANVSLWRDETCCNIDIISNQKGWISKHNLKNKTKTNTYRSCVNLFYLSNMFSCLGNILLPPPSDPTGNHISYTFPTIYSFFCVIFIKAEIWIEKGVNQAFCVRTIKSWTMGLSDTSRLLVALISAQYKYKKKQKKWPFLYFLYFQYNCFGLNQA